MFLELSAAQIVGGFIVWLAALAAWLIRKWIDRWEDRVIAIDERLDSHSEVLTEQRVTNATVAQDMDHIKTVVDTIGAGDAFFAFSAPCFAHGMPLDLVSFIGNAVGALAVQIMGNKKPVEKYELFQFIQSILK